MVDRRKVPAWFPGNAVCGAATRPRLAGRRRAAPWFGVCLPLAILATAGAVRGADAPAAAPQQLQAEALDLVRQLGDERFATREAATTRLIQLGATARLALEEGRTHADREIRYRSGRILSIIEEVEFERRLTGFAEGRTGSEYDLPGWKRYRERYGEDPETRALFVEMHRAEANLIRTLEVSPQAVGRALEFRSLQLTQGVRSSQPQVSLGTIAAMLFLADDEQVPVTAQTFSGVYRFCYQEPITSAMADPVKRKIVGKMLGAWIKRGEGSMIYQSLALAIRYDLKEGLVLATKVLENGADPPHMRQNAVAAVVKLGNDSHIPLIEKLLGDKAVLSTQRSNNLTIETQVRDIALAAAILLKKQQPKDFGFERLNFDASGNWIPTTAGFENDGKRTQAQAKWQAFRAAEKR